MNNDEVSKQQGTFGTWDDAERLRRWAFLQRSPQQRLDWLVEALQLAYQSGAIVPQRMTGPWR